MSAGLRVQVSKGSSEKLVVNAEDNTEKGNTILLEGKQPLSGKKQKREETIA